MTRGPELRTSRTRRDPAGRVPEAGDGPRPAHLLEWDVRPARGLAVWAGNFPDLVCTVRPIGFRWLIRCAGPAATLRELSSQPLRDATRIAVSHLPDESIVFAYSPEASEARLLRDIARAPGFVLPPIVVRNGTMRIRYVADPATVPLELPRVGLESRLVARRTLTPERLREELASETAGLPALSERQSEVLLAAVAAGYYEVPRRSNLGEIARGLHLGRSTAEEHLRLAESAIIRSAAPRVRLARQAEPSARPTGETEHFAAFSSELQLYVDLVLADRGITRVRLLRDAPPPGELRPHPHLHRILEHVRTGRDDLRDLPVDLAVSPFERQVLDELRRIPTGETRTYAEIARRIGRPGASRAVGNACAHNPVPLVIPCHRVVPARGGVGRYSATGGEETKRRLLRGERALPALAPSPPAPETSTTDRRRRRHR